MRSSIFTPICIRHFHQSEFYAGAVELRNLLSEGLKCELPSTVVFDYPSVAGLVSYISSLSLSRQSRPGPTVSASEAPRQHTTQSSGISDDIIHQKVANVLTDILGMIVDKSQPLSTAGMDSLAAVEVRNALSRYNCLLRLNYLLGFTFCVEENQINIESNQQFSLCLAYDDSSRAGLDSENSSSTQLM